MDLPGSSVSLEPHKYLKTQLKTGFASGVYNLTDIKDQTDLDQHNTCNCPDHGHLNVICR